MKPLAPLVVVGVLGSVAIGLAGLVAGTEEAPSGPASQQGDAAYEVDPSWPKPLPNSWKLGQVAGIAVDAQDHVWLVQRPGSLTDDERGLELDWSECCRSAPPVIELDAEGDVLRAWGGPAPCTPPPGVSPVVGGECYEWPESEHGVFVDGRGRVWIGGNGSEDHQVLAFSPEGRFLLQIGRAGLTGGDASTRLLGRPADVFVDEGANEVYVADGYLNHRVIAFDATTGRYKRRWGAYGYLPGDPRAPSQFGNPVHCINMADDGLIFVCDRTNDRAQVFRRDGTFVTELYVRSEKTGQGSVSDVDFSAEKAHSPLLLIADSEHDVVWVRLRDSGAGESSFGRSGRGAGEFQWVHSLALDSKGNVYTGEVDDGKRVQKFTLVDVTRSR